MIATAQLGRSGPGITRLGLGTWAIGGPWRFGWGPVDDAESIAAIRSAIEAGINWVDTAAIYGLGHSEEIVGRALEGYATGRDVFVCTKCGRRTLADGSPYGDLRPESIREDCEASLRRLGVERIDLYQIHWPDLDTGAALEDSWSTMAELADEGKVRWIGVSNFKPAHIARIEAIAPVTSDQPPYSILSPEIESDVLPLCAQKNIGVIVYSPMKSGLLTGAMTRERIAQMPGDDFRQRTVNFKEPLLSRNLRLVELLRTIGTHHGRTPGEVAIAWTLRRPEVTGAIVGMRSAKQVDGVIGAAGFRLLQEEVDEIAVFLKENTPSF